LSHDRTCQTVVTLSRAREPRRPFAEPVAPAWDEAANDDHRRPNTLQFRRYTVVPGARVILRDGQPIDLGGRAFDLLVLLLTARGTVVTKADILGGVWPSICVTEASLRFQIAMLRRALGKDAGVIKTVAGRGYLLADEAPDPASLEPAPRAAPSDARCAMLLVIDGDAHEALTGVLRSAGFDVAIADGAMRASASRLGYKW
jgi:DNA-binding winged helix-turn-helix (wHTH) protein